MKDKYSTIQTEDQEIIIPSEEYGKSELVGEITEFSPEVHGECKEAKHTNTKV